MNSAVTIIGNGIIGVTSAIELCRLGFKVTVIDRELPGIREAASFGNGGWLCPASIIPVSTPGLLWRLPSLAWGKNAPLSGQLLFGLRNIAHFTRFVMSGRTPKQVQHKARWLASLLSQSSNDHLSLAKQAGLEGLIKKDGLLYTYSSPKAYASDFQWWKLRDGLGVKSSFIDAKALRTEEPTLARSLYGAVLVDQGGHCVDPSGYVKGLADYAELQGVEFVTAHVNGLKFDGNRLLGLETSVGFHAAEQAVVCCGAQSRSIAEQANDRLPLLSERGYHITIENGPSLNRPIMFDDALMVATPMKHGLRFAGQVEIADPDTPPNWGRAQRLLDLANRYFGNLPENIDVLQVSYWTGNRPAMADELPVIGPSTKSPDVFYAFGHGYTGLGAAPATARLLGAAINRNNLNSNDLSVFRAQRF